MYAERVAQGYFTDIRIDRDAIARHGLTIEDVQNVIQSALGGENVTLTIEGRERYPVNVRYQREFRKNPGALERVLVKTPMGAQVPLGQLAEITQTTGPAMIRDENAQLAGYVYLDTSTRDIGGFVDTARRAIDKQLRLPSGYTLQWTGQYDDGERRHGIACADHVEQRRRFRRHAADRGADHRRDDHLDDPRAH